MQNKKVAINTFSGLTYQVIAICAGLVLPRLILSYYGSSVNGLANSITTLLNFLTLMEMGIGAVIQTALYKPIVEKDYETLSRIISYSRKFFRIIAIAFALYTIVLCVLYPFYVQKDFEFFFTMSLIATMSINSLSQYLFGIVDSLLLEADQKGYINNFLQAAVILVGTVVSSLVIIAGGSIQIVKLSYVLILLFRPIFARFYVRKHFPIKRVKADSSVLPQKWNGIAQHVATFVLDSTDIIVLTIFSNLISVSIYSVYYLVCHSLRLLMCSLTNGIMAYYGNLYASNKIDKLNKEFEKYTFIIQFFTNVVFSVAIVMIVPFVALYTKGVNDANYSQLLFGILLCSSQAYFCHRRCFIMLTNACNKYKETQASAFIEAGINITVSIVLVIFFGLIGVAIGTLCAMMFRTIYLSLYFSKRVINRSITKSIRENLIAVVSYIVFGFVALLIVNKIAFSSYLVWAICAVIITLCSFFVLSLLNVLFNFEATKNFFKFSFKRKKT